MLVSFIWETGSFANKKIGRLFEIIYSSRNHIGRSIKAKLEKNRRLKRSLIRFIQKKYLEFRIKEGGFKCYK
jgi:hypothetical protein